MKIIIVTWAQMLGEPFDIGVINDDSGEALIFSSYSDANNWIEENDNEVSTYFKLVEL